MMTPVYLNPASSPFSMVEQAEDQRLKLFISSPYPYDEAASCTSFPFPTFFDSLQDQTPGTTSTSLAYHQSQLYHHKADKNIWDCRTSYDQASSSSSLVQAHVMDAISNKDRRLSRCGDHEIETNIGGGGGGGGEEGKSSNYITSTRPKSVKWMSSKMRLMQKMTSNNPDIPPGTTDHIPTEISEHKFQIHSQPQENSETSFSSNSISNNTAVVRVCSDCNTNSTPLWRSGPRGPKSLCNACGIRQRKARRAMAEAAAAAANGFAVGSADTSSPKGKVAKEKKSRGSHKNKSKLIITDNASISQNNKRNNNKRKKICFKALDFQRVFPQDVAEAAMLLMELSCGLINNRS